MPSGDHSRGPANRADIRRLLGDISPGRSQPPSWCDHPKAARRRTPTLGGLLFGLITAVSESVQQNGKPRRPGT